MKQFIEEAIQRECKKEIEIKKGIQEKRKAKKRSCVIKEERMKALEGRMEEGKEERQE